MLRPLTFVSSAGKVHRIALDTEHVSCPAAAGGDTPDRVLEVAKSRGNP